MRLTALAPNVKGSLAKISSAISESGGLIHSLNAYVAEDPAEWGFVVKVADISKDELLEAVKPLVVEVLDVR